MLHPGTTKTGNTKVSVMAANMSGAGASAEEDDGFVYVYDRRSSDAPEVKISTGGLFHFSDLKERVRQRLGIDPDAKFVIATTNREPIEDDQTWDLIDKGDTLYVLEDILQDLCAPAQERVNYLPHYDTIIKGGMYEYYASEGQNPLAYAFAELIDNALAATVENAGSRNIDIRLHLDEAVPSRNCICVLDNGKGMTPRQLNNWAIYRLSKFNRRERKNSLPISPAPDAQGSGSASCAVEGEDRHNGFQNFPPPRFMNSDISYFGVGGKQAIFYIGTSTRMISQPKDSKDVHELTISKEDFEKKEKNHEAIYSGFIRNRKPGDSSHVCPDDEIVRKLISEEPDRESFTAVIVQGINPEHIAYLKHLTDWTRQLSHIYHFYIHGPNGNRVRADGVKRVPSPFNNIQIEVRLFTRGQTIPRTINLREVQDDVQTLLVQSASSEFEFKAIVDGSNTVEGVIRYHPFLYDQETFPKDALDFRMDPEPEDDHGYAINDRPARGRKPIFECYWNGRLIPYTFIEDFEWCTPPKKEKNVPIECYNRVSGVLWTNDTFQVSTNKLTFLDLEMKLKDKTTVFSRIVGSHEKRTSIEREFVSWLKECHEKNDKQIFFSGFLGPTVRTDLPKQKQTPWTAYTKVEWDGRTFQKGQMVKILRTVPTLMGTINRFLLYGEYDNDVFSTGGDIEIIQEPRSLYDEVKIVPLSKLDRSTSQAAIRKYIEEEEAKLPDHLVVSWPEGMEVLPNEKRPAGKTIGTIKVEISNKRGEMISKLPGATSSSKKLLVELKVIWHSPHGDETIVSHICQHGKSWPYWFRKMDNVLKNLGSHTIQLQTVLTETGVTTYSNRELPSHKIRFTVVEAEPEKFTVGLLDGPFRVGVPFQIPLEFQDRFNNPTKPSSKIQPTLQASGLELTFESLYVRGNFLYIKGVVAKGSVASTAGKNFSLTVSIPGLDEDSQTLKIRLLPGPVQSLEVTPKEEVEIENGNPVSFKVEVHDAAGNIASSDKCIVVAKFSGASGLPAYSVDLSATGTGTLTGDPIVLKKVKEDQLLTAKIEIQGSREVCAERSVRVLPSGRASVLEVSYQDRSSSKPKVIKAGMVIEGIAGETIEGLALKLIDEAGREITITDKLVPKIKVNWAPRVAKEQALQGRLPEIKVPVQTDDSKYCHVSLLDSTCLELSFTVKALPGPAAQLKCLCDGDKSVALHQLFPSDILISFTDSHGNLVTDMPPSTAKEIQVTGNSLCSDTIKVSHDKGKFVLRGVKFDKASVGTQEVAVSWQGLKDLLRFQVLAGLPARLDLPGWMLDQPVTVYNEGKMPAPLRVQLLDEDGNVSKTPDVKVQLYRDAKFKLVPSPTPTKTNAKGIADFGTFTVQGNQGVYELQPRAVYNKIVIAGPKLRISIQPDPNKPTALEVDYNKNAAVVAGEELPQFTVKVMSEGGVMDTANPNNVSMKIWKTEPHNQNTPPARATSYSPDTPGRHEKGVFHFKKRTAPEEMGPYSIIFAYFDGKHEIYSNELSVKIQAGVPCKLAPMQSPGTPTVSNTRNAASRCLIRSLRLALMDQYDNAAMEGYDGVLELEIVGPEKMMEIPCFIGGTKSLQLPLASGQCHLQNLMLQENSPGKDGQEYVLQCSVNCPQLPRSKSIPPFEIPFLFYNDAKKQSQMAALSKERDTLQTTIRAFKSLFETQQQLIGELRISAHEAQKEEQRLRGELRKQNIPSSQVQNLESVEKLIAARMKERDQLLQVPRRMCGLAPAANDPEILGKIAHLAQVEDEDIARTLSWHMSADMDCIVTVTTKKAKEIYHATQGKQQVLPLDSIFRKNLPDWNKPLPHKRFRANWQPAGNPVYAREKLIFPAHEEECRIVFGMLLGDTMILDDLDSANAYRQEIVKHTHCPTILTREGDRIRSNGKFGGAMNRALPMEKLRGAVFSEPLPMAYHALCTQIDTLQNFKAAMERHLSCKEELQEMIEAQKEPAMAAKVKECQEAENQLKAIEHKLGVGTPVRGRQSVGGASASSTGSNSTSPPGGGPPSKRQRTRSETPSTTAPSSPGGSEDSPSNDTPTRASKRIASMTTVITDDGRKRLRKT